MAACRLPKSSNRYISYREGDKQLTSSIRYTSSQRSERSSISEKSESVQTQTPSASSLTADSATSVGTDQTAEQATLSTEAKQTITQLTGYVESEVYLFIVESVEGNEVTINVRENGAEVSSSVGFYRYNGETGELLEMDIVTGEYVRHPAQY